MDVSCCRDCNLTVKRSPAVPLSPATGRLPGNVTSIRLGQADVQPSPRPRPLASTAPSDPVVDTGMVVTVDLGDRYTATDVHPRNKTEVARRMGTLLRRVTYATYDSSTVQHPRLEAATFVNDATAAPAARSKVNTVTVRVQFSHVADLVGFQHTHSCIDCCTYEDARKASSMVQLGTSNSTVPATAGSGWYNATVTLSSTEPGVFTASAIVPTSVASDVMYVRYAASDYPECVLVGDGQLPAGPFLEEIVKTVNTNGARTAGHDGNADVAALADVSAAQHVEVGGAASLLLPAMGFNSWNRFHCDIDESIIRRTF